jgi:septum formation protein
MQQAEVVVLASASATRAEMLRRAGVPVICDPADLDETEIKMACDARGDGAEQTARTLAEAKALVVSGRRRGVFVIGADQMLECDGQWFSKARDRGEARAALQALRGRAHRLISAAAVARDGHLLWDCRTTAELVMRPFSDAFLDAYLVEVGPAVLSTVGGYRLEGLGIQLFERIDGDFFSILGLPMLPLLGYLRRSGILVT